MVIPIKLFWTHDFQGTGRRAVWEGLLETSCSLEVHLSTFKNKHFTKHVNKTPQKAP